MKGFLLTTSAGHLLLKLREKWSLIKQAAVEPESVGTAANDYLALDLVTQLCRPNRVFVDVGAHIGSIIAGVHRHDKTIQIIAIEAIPEKVERLKQRFPYADIHSCAAGDQEGEVTFYINTKSSAYSSLLAPATDNQDTVPIRTEIKTLDSLAPEKGVDVVKIDVEGAELGVIRGAKQMFSSSRPILMFESGSMTDGSKPDKEGIWRELDALDYVLLLPNRVAHNGDGLSLEGFLDAHVYPRATTNYFAIPRERRLEVRDKAREIVGVAIN